MTTPKKKAPNKHRELIQYLKQTITWLEEHEPTEDDNEIILLNLIRELQKESPVMNALTRERLHHIAEMTEKQANPNWTNPFTHYTVYKNWGKRVVELLELKPSK